VGKSWDSLGTLLLIGFVWWGDPSHKHVVGNGPSRRSSATGSCCSILRLAVRYIHVDTDVSNVKRGQIGLNGREAEGSRLCVDVG
jgi:hypothetical protein